MESNNTGVLKLNNIGKRELKDQHVMVFSSFFNTSNPVIYQYFQSLGISSTLVRLVKDQVFTLVLESIITLCVYFFL